MPPCTLYDAAAMQLAMQARQVRGAQPSPKPPVIVYTGTRVTRGERGGGSFNSSQIPEIYMENVKSVNQPQSLPGGVYNH